MNHLRKKNLPIEKSQKNSDYTKITQHYLLQLITVLLQLIIFTLT